MACYSKTSAAVASLSLILIIITITGGGGLLVAAADICPAVGKCICNLSPFNGTNTQEEVLKTLDKSTNSQCLPVSYNDAVFQITVWRFAWCRGGLGDADCKTCFNKAVTYIREICPYTQGAKYRLTEDCCVRYEIYDFCSDPGHE